MKENILRETIAPARVSEQIIKKCRRNCRENNEVLKGAGVFGIEMFVTQDDQIVINEIAPRVHNLDIIHYNQVRHLNLNNILRAILGLELEVQN